MNTIENKADEQASLHPISSYHYGAAVNQQ